MDRTSPAALPHPVRALVVGYALGFLLPWTVWGSLIAEQRGLLGWHLPQALSFWLGLPIAVIAASMAGGGWAGLRLVLKRLLHWRTGWQWYAGAVVAAVGVPALVWFFARVTQVPAPSDALPLGQVPVFLVIETMMFWLTEEAIWRGLAQPTFELWLNPALASLVVGVLWALWHLPLFAISSSFQAGLPYAGFFVLTVATAVVLGWLFHQSGGSLVVCAVYHGVVDVTFAASGVLGASSRTFWAVVGLQCLLALLAWRDLSARPTLAVSG